MTSINSWSDLFRDTPEEQLVPLIRHSPGLVNIADSQSWEYALEQAVFHEKPALAEALLDLGSDPNQLNDQGRNALHTAIELFDDSPEIAMQLVELLLRRGADIEARAFPDFTALHRACATNAIPIVLLLLEHGASLHATAEAWIDGGRTPLDVASTHSFTALASILRSKGGRSVDDPPGNRS